MDILKKAVIYIFMTCYRRDLMRMGMAYHIKYHKRKCKHFKSEI